MKRREFIAVVGTGIGISVAGCSSSGDSTTETTSTGDNIPSTQKSSQTTNRANTSTRTTEQGETSTSSTTTTGAGSESLTLGETVTLDSGIEATTKTFRFESEYESSGTTQSTNQTFLFVEFTVENPTGETKEIPSGMSIYVTADGERYEPVDYKGAVRSLYTKGSLDAKATRSGILIFDVPSGTSRSDVTAYLKYSGASGTVTVQWNDNSSSS